jgi:hypothetical protein
VNDNHFVKAVEEAGVPTDDLNMFPGMYLKGTTALVQHDPAKGICW